MMVRFWVSMYLLSSLALAQDIVFDYSDLLNAIATSPRVSLAVRSLELAEAQVQTAGSLLTGELSAGYSRTWSNAEGSEAFDDPSGSDVDPIALTTSLNVVPYGPRYDGLERARAELLRAQAALQEARAETLITATQQFQDLLQAEARVSVQGTSLALAGARLEDVTLRLEDGAANETEQLQAEVALARAEREIVAAEREAIQTLNALSTTLGQTLEGVAGEVPESSLPEGLALDALERRSDALGARLDLAEARRSAAATLRDNLPGGRLSVTFQTATPAQSLNLGGSFSTETFQPVFNLSYDPDTGVPGLDAGSAQSFSLSLGLTVPLDTALPAALRAAELAIQQREMQLEQTLALARLEVEGALAELEAAEASLSLTADLLKQSEQAFEVTQTRFELGIVSSLDLAQAELDLAGARLELQSAEDRLRLAQMNLLASLDISPLEVF